MSKPSKTTNKRILLVNANWLGDVLFSTPAIRALRKNNPDAHMACLVPPRVQGVLTRNPHLNEVLTYNDRATLFSAGECARVIGLLRSRQFDEAIFFHRSKTKVFFAKMAGIRGRIGYSAPGRDGMLTRAVPMPATPLHKIDLFLNLLSETGVPPDGRHMEFFPDPASAPVLAKLLEEHGIESGVRYAVVHPGGNWALKRWPVEHFIRSIELFKKQFGFKVVLCGTTSEWYITEKIRSSFSARDVVSLCGKTSLDQLALLLKGAEFLLSNDSGPIHLAASQKTRIVGLFGPTQPEMTGPASLGPMRILSKDVGCDVPCYYRSCNHRVCMEWLTPEEALAASRELVGG